MEERERKKEGGGREGYMKHKSEMSLEMKQGLQDPWLPCLAMEELATVLKC